MNLVSAVAYHSCLSLPVAFTQPGRSLLAELCTTQCIKENISRFPISDDTRTGPVGVDEDGHGGGHGVAGDSTGGVVVAADAARAIEQRAEDPSAPAATARPAGPRLRGAVGGGGDAPATSWR